MLCRGFPLHATNIHNNDSYNTEKLNKYTGVKSEQYERKKRRRIVSQNEMWKGANESFCCAIPSSQLKEVSMNRHDNRWIDR